MARKTSVIGSPAVTSTSGPMTSTGTSASVMTAAGSGVSRFLRPCWRCRDVTQMMEAGR